MSSAGPIPARAPEPQPVRERALALLRTAVGSQLAEFRPGQWEALQTLLRGQRLLVVQRTGWGKSVVYFVATRLLRERGAGPALLVSPLLALMRNQVEAARRLGLRAETINSSNTGEWPRIQSALRRGEVDLLLVSPERLANAEFMQQMLRPIAATVGLLVVDEAHCISDWGHDFRPDYRRIVRVLESLPESLPVLATTATANNRVVEDVEQQLGPRLHTLRGPLGRESLYLQNIALASPAARMAWIAHRIGRWGGSGIIYTLTIHDAENLAAWLRERGIDAEPYHGEMEATRREELEARLLHNQVKVLVATVALGMGFDKPDLSFVVHYQRPPSVVHYYQQIGRAGRAVQNAVCVLLSGAEDQEVAGAFISAAFPTADEVHQVLEVLRRAHGPLRAAELEEGANLSRGRLQKTLRFLLLESPAPVEKSEKGYRMVPTPWRLPVERMDRMTAQRRREQQRMGEYAAWIGCLMRFLQEELNDASAADCGHCANCSGPRLHAGFPVELAQAAAEFLNRGERVIVPRQMWPPGIARLQGRIADDRRMQPGRVLCRWGEGGYGDWVRHDKQARHFRDELVEAAVALIRERWRPEPFPTWVTCVPSWRQNRLVTSLARRLADRLRIDFVPCIWKSHETVAQKSRSNSVQQVRNLLDAFEISTRIVRPQPVLLVDDVVDSRWTMTLLAYRLQEAGSGPVYPFALADTSTEGRGR